MSPYLIPAAASNVWVGPGMISSMTVPSTNSAALEIESMNWRIVRLEQYAFYHTQIAQDRTQNKHAPATRPGWPLEAQLIPPDAFYRGSPASSDRDRPGICEFEPPG